MIHQNELIVRDASAGDVEALSELSHRTVLAKYPAVIGSQTVTDYVASGVVPTYYLERFVHCRVGMLDDVVVGCCALRNNSVDLMMVDVEHHRMGIGAILLKDAEERLFETYDSIFLNSFRDNLQAIAFYKKNGWVEDCEFVDAEHGISMVRLMKKNLRH